MTVSFIPSDPKTRLGRDRLALALEEAGWPTSALMLASLAAKKRGPPFVMEQIGGRGSWRAVYEWGKALAWAKKNRRSVSETVAA